MQPFTLEIGNLKPKWPIVQGGMGVGISLSKLAGAVAKCGGIGVISAAQPGYSFPGFDSDPLEANIRALKHYVAEALEISGGGIIGVNIMCASRQYAEYVRGTVESGAHLIISGAGLPVNLPELIGDSDIKIAPIVSSAKAAKVLLSLWDRRYARTADLVVIEGPKAGGHLGFSAEQALSYDNYEDEIQAIRKIVAQYADKYGVSVPVIFGGGVYTHEDIEHYLELGCDGVQMASRFVATEECDAHPDYKAAYVSAGKDDIVIIKSPVGMPGRAIANKFVKGIGEKPKIRKCWRCLSHCDPATTPYCISQALINAASGKLDEGLIFCGSEAARIDRISTVEEIMKELTGQI